MVTDVVREIQEEMLQTLFRYQNDGLPDPQCIYLPREEYDALVADFTHSQGRPLDGGLKLWGIPLRSEATRPPRPQPPAIRNPWCNRLHLNEPHIPVDCITHAPHLSH